MGVSCGAPLAAEDIVYFFVAIESFGMYEY